MILLLQTCGGGEGQGGQGQPAPGQDQQSRGQTGSHPQQDLEIMQGFT